jgi:hypothetical protein
VVVSWIQCVSFSPVANITEVFSIEDLKERQKASSKAACGSSVPWEASQPPAQSFNGILYPYLTQLNITSGSKSAVCYRW